MSRVFIYWDNSNVFHEAQRSAEERNEGPDARYRVRINFDNILRLAHADRTLGGAVAAGSIPPEMRQLWNRMEAAGVEVRLRMLEDALDHNGTPGVVVLLTGDGAGYYEGTGFHSTLERMHKRDWRVEILSWRHSCNERMRQWAESNGLFVAMDDSYDAITFMTPSRPGFEHALGRQSSTLDVSLRKTS